MDLKQMSAYLDMDAERAAYIIKALRAHDFIPKGKRGVKDKFSDEVVDLVGRVEQYTLDGFSVPQSLRLIEEKSDPSTLEQEVKLLKQEVSVLKDAVARRPPVEVTMFGRLNTWVRGMMSKLRFWHKSSTQSTQS